SQSARDADQAAYDADQHIARADGGIWHRCRRRPSARRRARVDPGDPADKHVPTPLHEGLLIIVESLRGLERRSEIIERQIVARGRDNQTCRHLITIPGYGPILSSAMAALVVDPAAFTGGRHFSASLGLVPRQDGTGGKVKLGPISKRGTAICAGC